MGSATSRRDPGGSGTRRDHSADSIAATAGEVSDGGSCGNCEISLLATCGAEIEAGGQVHHHPGFELSIGDGLAHVRMRRARGHRPVHLTNVVTGLIFTRITGFGSRSGNQPEVITVQHPVESATNRQLEGAQRGSEGGIV